MGACTVPPIFGLKNWFDARFDDLCVIHDMNYKFQVLPKLQADLMLTFGMWRRGYYLLSIATLFFY